MRNLDKVDNQLLNQGLPELSYFFQEFSGSFRSYQVVNHNKKN